MSGTVEELQKRVAHLEEQNRDFVGLINNSYDAFTILDGEGRHLLVSPAIERLTGLKTEEILGQKVSKFHQDMDSTVGASERVIQTGQRQTAVVKTKVGRKLLVTAVPVFDDEGKIYRIYCNLRDTTELDQVREKFEQSQTLMTKYLLELQEVKKLCTMQTQFLAHSKQMKRVLEMAFRIARVDARVLITGESGVGKELIARIIHESSPRSQTGTFVKLNCGAIPAELLESELFGYDGGAFTGADRNGKPGYFEVADRGTLLLDEIGDLPLKLQVKLLSVLQDQEITRLGGYRPKKIDVRILAATNQDLEGLVESGAFRKDLFYRLSVVPIHILPLRERTDDIPFLLVHYLNLYNRKYGLQTKLSKDAMDELCAYRWPGNVRELANLMEYLVVSTDTETVSPQDLPQKYAFGNKRKGEGTSRGRSLREEMDKYEQTLIKEELSHSTSLEEAAQHLGISLATLVRRKRAIRGNGHA
jgi:PAS domain S-box-containing protein